MKMLKVFSQFLLGFGLLLSSAIALNAQAELAVADLSQSDAYVSPATHKSYEANHTQAAMSQLSAHMAKHIEYPEFLRSLEIGGTVVIEVQFDDTGRLIKSRIVQKATTFLDNAVMKSLSNFDAIKIGGIDYQGVKTVQIPIQFKN